MKRRKQKPKAGRSLKRNHAYTVGLLPSGSVTKPKALQADLPIGMEPELRPVEEVVVPEESESLVELIKQSISLHGPVSFKWFMEQALYHPECGYYASGKASIGRGGDFYTNISVGNIYGQLMAKQFEEIWNIMDRPDVFAIMEQGANDARFADDVLTWLHHYSPDLARVVKYWIIEPFPHMRQVQEQTLSKWPKSVVRWSTDMADIADGSLHGVHFSNELLDAMPVHLVSWVANEWHENYVDYSNGKFRFVYGPASSDALKRHLRKLPAVGIEHYRTEVNLRSIRWLEDLAKVMVRGYVLAVDYGHPRQVYYSEERKDGTLLCYHKHRKLANPLEQIGGCDITSHVEFTSLVEHAEALELDLEGFTDQHHFMVGLGQQDLENIEKQYAERTPEIDEFIRRFKTLMHPSMMGATFKVLCLRKRMDTDEKLCGFRYAGDPRVALGLEAE